METSAKPSSLAMVPRAFGTRMKVELLFLWPSISHAKSKRDEHLGEPQKVLPATDSYLETVGRRPLN